jgi:hypothetical protein
MKHKNVLSSIVATMALLWLAGCQPEEPSLAVSTAEEEQELATIAATDAEVDEVLMTVADAESELFEFGSGGRGRHFPCATITWNEVEQILTLDFGEGCTGPRGRYRSGKIIIDYNEGIGDGLANLIITFDNYVVNRKGIDGVLELRDVSRNEDGYRVCTNKIIDLTITWPNGNSTVYNGTRTREQLNQEGTRFKITGWMSGLSSAGRSFEQEITKPVIVDWTCREQGFFARVEGIIEITKIAGLRECTRTIDYGDGTCDNLITITIEGKASTISPED